MKIEILNFTPVRRKVEFPLTIAQVEFSHSTPDLMPLVLSINPHIRSLKAAY
jgi:hypothetical protein